MNKSNFYIASLRYTPGNWQHMNSFGRCLIDHEISTKFILSSKYSWMNQVFEDETTYITGHSNWLTSITDIFSFLFGGWIVLVKLLYQNKPSAMLLVMWHPLNVIISAITKIIRRDAIVLAWMHEPYKTPKDRKSYGIKKFAISIVEFFQTLSLPFIDYIIVHSQKAKNSFNLRYPWYSGTVKMIPLQYRDEGFFGTQRNHITFLGKAAKAKGIDTFFKFVNSNFEKQLGLEFQIVTPDNLTPYIKRLPKGALTNLKIINKPMLSDEDLRHAAGNSLAILAPYKNTMQSGVIPLALMCGTPIIATQIGGLSEFLKPNETVIYLSENPTIYDLIKAKNQIKQNYSIMSAACRDEYLDRFDDGNWTQSYSWLIKHISPNR